MDDEIECQTCGWSGTPDECVCSEEEATSAKPTSECRFSLCPKCGGKDMEDLE